MSNFVHLHGHTERGSVLDACGSIKKIVARAKSNSLPAIAITEHGTMASMVEMYLECKKHNIKYIPGCEYYMVDDHEINGLSDEEKNVLTKDERKERVAQLKKTNHLTVLAMNNEGLQNLFKLTTIANRHGYYARPRIDWKLLEKHNSGLIVLTGCTSSKFNSYIAKWPKKSVEDVDEGDKSRVDIVDDLVRAEAHLLFLRNIFNDCLYGELQVNGSPVQKHFNKRVIELCRKHDIPLVVTNDFHYVEPEDEEVHRMWKYIAWYKVFKQKNQIPYQDFAGYGTKGHFVANRDEMRKQWIENHNELGLDVFEEAADNTVKIADRCSVSLQSKIVMPSFPIPSGMSQDEYLDQLIVDGWAKRLPQIPENRIEEYRQRIDQEKDVIRSMGFVGYFLVVHEALNWCRENGIAIGPGRGSSAGSLLCWVIGITEVDSIKYNLSFERFLNIERKKLPDIDMDICSVNREKLIEHLKNKYGRDNVATVLTYNTFSHNTILRDIASAMGIPNKEVNEVCKKLDEGLKIQEKKEMSWEDKRNSCDLALDFVDRYPYFEKYMELAGNTRNYGTHAAAIVIANEGIDKHVPVMRVGRKGNYDYSVTVEKELLEHVGLIKFDFLGVIAVTYLDRAAKKVGFANGVYDLYKIEPNDPKVFEMFQNADTVGVFQFEQEGFTNLTVKIAPQSLDDLAVINALYRPAVLDIGADRGFVRRRNGDEEVDYIHPVFEDILKPTYGMIVYQEQTINMLNRMGLSKGDADIVRRNMEQIALGKKTKASLDEYIAKMRDKKFNNLFDESTANKIIDKFLQMCSYSFNLSHSISYGLIGYYCQYMKCYHLDAFAEAYINCVINQEKQRKMINYLRKKKYQVSMGNINTLSLDFTVSDNKMYYSAAHIKGLSENVINEIVSKRPYTSFRDFYYRIDRRLVNSAKLDTLIDMGFFEDIPLIETNTNIKLTRRQLKQLIAELRNIDQQLLVVSDKYSVIDYNNKAGDRIGQIILELNGGMQLEDLEKLKRKVKLDHLSDCMKVDLWREIYKKRGIGKISDYSMEEKEKIEKDYLSFNVLYDIVELLKKQESKADLETLLRYGDEVVFAVIKEVRLWKDKKKKEMAFVSVYTTKDEDLSITIFASDWALVKDKIKVGVGGSFTCSVDENSYKKGEKSYLLRRFMPIGWAHSN